MALVLILDIPQAIIICERTLSVASQAVDNYSNYNKLIIIIITISYLS